MSINAILNSVIAHLIAAAIIASVVGVVGALEGINLFWIIVGSLVTFGTMYSSFRWFNMPKFKTVTRAEYEALKTLKKLKKNTLYLHTDE